jgi:hypothetical protein
MSHTPAPLDEQQAQLVERLRAASGAPVSFAELRAIGIENPALLCYELAAVGLPVTRTCSPGEGMPALSVRLEPEREQRMSGDEVSDSPESIDAEVASRPRLPPRPRVPPRPRPHPTTRVATRPCAPPRTREVLSPRVLGWLTSVHDMLRVRERPLEASATRLLGWLRSVPARLGVLRAWLERIADSLDRLAGAASGLERRVRRAWQTVRRARPPALISVAGLALTLVAVVAIVLGNESGNGARVRTGGAGGHSRHTGISAGSRGPGQAGAASARVAPASGVSPRLGPPGTQTRVSLADAEAFEAEGHRLLAEGSYASAIDRLSAAIGASGQSLAACSVPASEACLTFAYALYDLGRALRLGGHHAEAIAVLSERLRIDNQRPTVQHELELARGAPA